MLQIKYVIGKKEKELITLFEYLVNMKETEFDILF